MFYKQPSSVLVPALLALPRYLAYRYPCSCLAFPKLRSIVCFRSAHSPLPELLSRFALTFSLLSSNAGRVTILRWFFERARWSSMGQA
jgi:hypothetical protein